MYNAFMKSMCIPLYKHRKTGKRSIEKWRFKYIELSHAGTTKNSCVFFHKITFRPLLSLQLNLVQENSKKTKAFADAVTDRNK